jgi:hypothetical protein
MMPPLELLQVAHEEAKKALQLAKNDKFIKNPIN